MTKVTWMAAALLAAAACGDDGNNKLPDSNPGSDGHPGSDATPEQSAETKTINGTASLTYLIPSVDPIVVIPDLTGETVIGYSPEGGDWLARPGTTGPGTFSFDVDASAASWMYSRVTSSGSSIQTFVSDSTSPSWDAYVAGRPDVAYPTGDTETTFALDGMTAWQAGDQLETYSAGNGGAAFGVDQFPLTEPNPGDTSIDQTFDWENLFVPLTADGDGLAILHLSGMTSGNVSYQALTDLASVDVTQTDSTPSTVTATFDAVTRDETYALDWHGSAFEAQRTAAGIPAASAIGQGDVGIDALYAASQYGFYSSAPDLALFYGDNTDAAGTLSYGNPFRFGKGSLYDEFAIYGYQWLVGLPVGNTTASYSLGFYAYVPVADATTITPTLTAPTNIEINHLPAVNVAALTGVTATPTISWSAPATGTPNQYFVVIVQPRVQSGFGSVATVASFNTPNTSLAIPAAYLSTGQKYYAIVSAVKSNTDYDNTPYKDALGFMRADAITTSFTP